MNFRDYIFAQKTSLPSSEDYQTGYNAGYEAGKSEGGDSDFWDIYQDNGNRTIYDFAFRNAYWKDENFNPKYITKVSKAYYMFSESTITDHEKIATYFDFSECTNANYAFSYMAVTRLKQLDFTSVTTATSVFANSSSLQTIDKIIINSDGSFPFANSTFQNCRALKEIRFGGIIGASFYIQAASNLSKDSIINIFSVLSSSTSGLSVNFSKTAVNKAFGTDGSTSNGSSSDEWAALVATKPNWTVNLT